MSITENYQKIRKSIPEHVTIVVAAKQRTPNEIIEFIKAGATDIGENYVQEGEKIYNALGEEKESAETENKKDSDFEQHGINHEFER